MPDEPRIASGHGEIAEKARANVIARRLGQEADEGTVRTAAAALAEWEAARGDASPHDLAAPPLAIAAMGDHLASRVAALAAQLRAHGARVGLGEVLTAERALAAVDAADRTESYYALRAALCSTRAEQVAFATAFTAVFGADEVRSPLDDLGEIAKQALPRVAVPQQGDEAPANDLTPAPSAWSEEELLREKDFGAYTDAERAVARRLLARIALRAPKRRSRRTVPTKRRRDEHDLRATVRASLRHGGELFERRYREQAFRPRRLVLICDVSGSMAPYSRMLLQYMQACVAARARVEAFVFGTRLTRVTRELRGRDSDRALSRAAAAVNDWAGGTRIGEAIAELNREHGRRIGRGSMVILLSDGWDRGEPEQLAEEMARLARTAHRVVWLNPLAADPRYEPLTRGMKAAMPHVDRLLPGNSIASLETLADLMEQGDGVNVSGLILAAGAGTRFGASTKQLAPLRGKPLLQHAVDSMTAVLPCVVVLGHDADAIRAGVDFGGASTVLCPDWARGQGFSLRRGVEALGDVGAAVVTLGDQPFITPDVILGALGELPGFDAVRAVYRGAPGHPVVLSRRVMDAVGELEGDAGARELLARFRVRKWEAGHLASATDIDTPEELSRV